MKKILACILTLTLLCGGLMLPAQAADYATATVKGGWLRLRSEPNDKATTISAYFTGTKVTILGGSGEWYRVLTPDGKTGYMYSGYLTISGSITGGQLAENTIGVVTSDNGGPVRLRASASENGKILSTFKVGTPLTILSTGETWSRIRINGETGYMMTQYIRAGVASKNYMAYVVAENGKNCVVRGGASTDEDILASWPVGKQLTVLNYGATWSEVSADGINGYMMSQYISTDRPDVLENVAYTAYVTSKNGLGVRMRSGANKIFPTVATYSVGTAVIVLEKGTTWSQIRVGNTTGYMMTEFLTTTPPDLGVTVKISAASAKAGDILYAQVTPASASVSIAWVNDKGATVGYGTSYTVRTSDEGRKIRATATGIGNTSGSDVSGWCTVQTTYISQVYYLMSASLSSTAATVGKTLTVTLSPAAATANINWYRENGTWVGSGASYTVRTADVGQRLYAKATGTGNTSGEVTTTYTNAAAAAVTTIVLQSVTISDTTPNVGQTLSAQVYPTNASAAFTWRCSDGRILGYGATYTVTAEEDGDSIYVYANGTNGTSGSVVSSLTSAVKSADTAEIRVEGVTLSDLTPVVGQTLVATVNPGNANVILTWFRDDDVILTYGNTYTVRAEDEGHSLYIWAEGQGSTFGSATSKITGIITR